MTHQEVPHCPHVAAVGVQVPRDQPARRPQPRDHGRVLRARPQSRLLAAAVEHRGHGDTLLKSNTIKETIRVCVRSVSSFVLRHTSLQKSLIRRIDSANKY